MHILALPLLFSCQGSMDISPRDTDASTVITSEVARLVSGGSCSVVVEPIGVGPIWSQIFAI